MGKVARSIEIEVSPKKVFAFMLDMEKQNEIRKGVSKGKYTSKGPVRVGTTLHMIEKQAEFDMEITEFERNKKISMRSIGASKVKIKRSWTLEPTAKGTKLTTTSEYDLPYSILGKIVDKLRVSKELEKATEKTLSNMKNPLEEY